MMNGATIFIYSFLLFLNVYSYPRQLPIGVLLNSDREESSEILEAYNLAINEQRRLFNKTFAEIYKVTLVHSSLEGNQGDAWKIRKTICSMMRQGYFVLSYDGQLGNYWMIDAMHEDMNIATININLPGIDETRGTKTHGRKTKRLSVSVMPPIYKVIVDLIIKMNWTQLIYVYDSDDGLLNMQRIIDRHMNQTEKWGLNYRRSIPMERIRVKKGFDASIFINELHEKKPSNPQRVICDFASAKRRRAFLAALKNISLEVKNADVFDGKGINFHYLLNDLDFTIEDRNEFLSGVINVTGLSLVRGKLAASYSSLKLIAFDAMLVAMIAIERAFKDNSTMLKSYFRGNQVYSANGDRGFNCEESDSGITKEHGTRFHLAMRNMHTNGLSGNIQFDKFGLRENFSVEIFGAEFAGTADQYNSHEASRKTMWNEPVGFVEQYLGHQRHNKLQGGGKQPYRVVTVKKEPFLFALNATETDCQGNDCFEGYIPDLLFKMKQKDPTFDYELHLVGDDNYGSKNEKTGEWDGMIGELINGMADIAIADLTITEKRQKVVDFSKPFMTLGLSIMIKKPAAPEFSVFSFMSPLSPEIWMYIVFAYLGVSVVIFLVSRFSPYEWRIEESVTGSFFISNDFSVYNCLWFTIASFLQQGTEILPRSISGRIAGGVWWFFSMIIVSSYTANLAAFLTLEKMQTPIKSADDLSKQTKIKYGIQSSGSTNEFFKYSQVQTYQRMWQFMSAQQPSVFVSNYGDGVDRVRTSKNARYAFILESTANEYTNAKKPCDTTKVGTNLNTVGYGVATRFGSELKYQINLAILGLQEKGDLKNLENKWWIDKGECDDDEKGEVKSGLTLNKVAGIFYILVGGMTLSLLTSSIEFVYRSRIEARKKNMSLQSVMGAQLHLALRGERVPGHRLTTQLTNANPVTHWVHSSKFDDSADDL